MRNGTLDAVIREAVKENKLPWEINDGKGKIQQRGRGGFEKSSSAEEEDFIYAVTAIPVQANGMFQNTAGLFMPFGERCVRLGNRSMNRLG